MFLGIFKNGNRCGLICEEDDSVIADDITEKQAEQIMQAVNNQGALSVLLDSIIYELSTHPEVDKGNSKVHFVYHKLLSAARLAKGAGKQERGNDENDYCARNQGFD